MNPKVSLFWKDKIWQLSQQSSVSLQPCKKYTSYILPKKTLFEHNGSGAVSSIREKLFSSRVYQEQMVNFVLTNNAVVTKGKFRKFTTDSIFWNLMLFLRFSSISWYGPTNVLNLKWIEILQSNSQGQEGLFLLVYYRIIFLSLMPNHMSRTKL